MRHETFDDGPFLLVKIYDTSRKNADDLYAWILRALGTQRVNERRT